MRRLCKPRLVSLSPASGPGIVAAVTGWTKTMRSREGLPSGVGESNRLAKKMGIFVAGITAVVVLLVLRDCSRINGPSSGVLPPPEVVSYPAFITANKDYYITRIGDVPQISADTFHLQITGLVDTPRSFSLHDLMSLPLVELPLTVSCIGNGPNGSLVSTAVWKGFRLYDLLVSLGLDSNATGVKYLCADGYYASHTMDQIKNNGVLGALFMNGDTLPPEHGFPLRFLNPGYYGAKNPAWVVSIEVSGQPVADYWGDRGWDVSPPIAVDSRIFFPTPGSYIAFGDTLFVGGASYGGRRIAKTEVSIDAGATWRQADIVQTMDADNVWTFWLAKLVNVPAGSLRIYARATDVGGLTQPQTDTNYANGFNAWSSVGVGIVR